MYQFTSLFEQNMIKIPLKTEGKLKHVLKIALKNKKTLTSFLN